MHASTVVGYTFEADNHCDDCIRAMFGPVEVSAEAALDKAPWTVTYVREEHGWLACLVIWAWPAMAGRFPKRVRGVWSPVCSTGTTKTVSTQATSRRWSSPATCTTAVTWTTGTSWGSAVTGAARVVSRLVSTVRTRRRSGYDPRAGKGERARNA